MNKVFKTKHSKNQLNIIELISVIDTSKQNARQLFYNLCFKTISAALRNSSTFKGIRSLISIVIDAEKSLFNNRRVLNFIRSFLIAHSDGDSIQCQINLQLLDYILSTYH
ncbi:hypothetical protein [Rachiplusia nu nucleopolyhedrovirus]|uniref:Ac19-like protein n=1 Tax=Rachiplusia nu nucleopolyhedrovirus TaxID=2605775 RepID=A0AAF1DB39_9ABAC|nr:hypothetical protein QKQ55_gp109 [Rachiplusia nu nucleopolyhedrovirus]QEI03627.1 hypothetical protein [Rachiplusia nu nucleopolyhedrovirus]